eukprot:XP_001706607.1 Hypothetical protein GL50803_114039 [Giardia lamblia ATCC 50803]
MTVEVDEDELPRRRHDPYENNGPDVIIPRTDLCEEGVKQFGHKQDQRNTSDHL